MASRGSDDDDPSDGQAAMQDRIMSMLMGFGPPGSGINARGQIAGLPPGADPNELFYKNELASQPDGVLIDTIHAEWADDYDRLEINHGYIQWLFPVFESAGMNWESQPLTKAGAAAIRADAAASERVIRSYKMMLRFYGFKLNDERTGDISRDEPHHAEQLRLFNSRPHNFLRISRILTSLGELGFVRYKQPFLHALRNEVEIGTLFRARDSCYNYWMKCVEYDDASYARKTKEKPEDRTEGVLFQPGGRLAAAAE